MIDIKQEGIAFDEYVQIKILPVSQIGPAIDQRIGKILIWTYSSKAILSCLMSII